MLLEAEQKRQRQDERDAPSQKARSALTLREALRVNLEASQQEQECKSQVGEQ